MAWTESSFPAVLLEQSQILLCQSRWCKPWPLPCLGAQNRYGKSCIGPLSLECFRSFGALKGVFRVRTVRIQQLSQLCLHSSLTVDDAWLPSWNRCWALCQSPRRCGHAAQDSCFGHDASWLCWIPCMAS